MNHRQTAEEVFHLAREKSDSAERAGFLDGACGNDLSLRAKVEALLKADREAGEFLLTVEQAVPPAVPSTKTFTESSGKEHPDGFGRYRVLQQIGEGGFGVVYMAEQREPVRRRVALKVIKLGMDTQQVIARFEAERQALAMMDHPNIAKVLDAGSSDSGRPYFVMEYIKGVPIVEYCDTEKLDTKHRLELFTKVCHAIQHAHQKGIIHRDIKPNNVLITMHDGVPVPKVIDFGIAKATSAELTTRTLFTEHRQMIGTPAYMSPEQAEMSGLDIDTRSDIYSLGVLLYELLTGTTPFDTKQLISKGFAEMMRIIREVEPPKPSTRLSSLGDTGSRTAQQRRTDLNKLGLVLRGDLDWIVMKCLEKDRTRRYETANGLAADIHRHLSHEPVTAGPPSAGYKLRKFVRRNKGPVSAALLVAAVLVLGVIGTTGGMFWAIQEKNRADTAATNATQAAERESQAKLEADQRRQEAERNLEYAQKGNAILGSVFENLNPSQEYSTVAELRSALKANLEHASRELEGTAIGDPLVVAEMQGTLGQSLVNMGAADLAIPLFIKAGDVLQAQLGPDDPNTLLCMQALANAYSEAGDLERARPLTEDTLRRQKETLGPDHPDTLTTMNNLASVYVNSDQLDQIKQSIPLFEEVLERQTKTLGGDYPDNAAVQQNLGLAYRETGRLEEAIALLEQAVKLSKSSRGADNRETLICMTNLAQAYERANQFDLALPLYEETLERAKSHLGTEHPHTIKTKGILAHAYFNVRRFDEAISLFEELFRYNQATLGPEHAGTISKANDLGANYLGAGRVDEAIELLEVTHQIAENQFGAEAPVTQSVSVNLAAAYNAAGQLESALQLEEEGLALLKKTLGPKHPGTIAGMNNLATTYWKLGQFDKSIPLFEEALKLGKATLGPDNPFTLQTAANLGLNFQDAKRIDEAIPILEENFAIWKRKFGPNHPNTISSMAQLAGAYWRAGQLDKSIPLSEEVLRLRQTTHGPEHVETIAAMANLGVNYRDAGRLEEAVPLLEEAQLAVKEHPEMGWVTYELFDALMRVDSATAATHLRELVPQFRADFGEANVTTILAMNNLGYALLRSRQFADAEPMLEETIEFEIQALDDQNDLPLESRTQLEMILLQTRTNLGEMFQMQQRNDEAVALLRECLAEREQREPSSFRLASIQSMLGRVMAQKKLFADAELLLLAGYQGLVEHADATPHWGKYYLPDTQNWLAELYEEWGKPDEAAKWRKEVGTGDDNGEVIE